MGKKKRKNPSRADRFADAVNKIEDGKADLEGLKEELEEWLGNMPENLQQGQKAEELQTAIDELEEMEMGLDEVTTMTVEFPGMY